MPFLTNVPLPQCLQHSSATRCLLARDHDRGCTRYLLEVKCLRERTHVATTEGSVADVERGRAGRADALEPIAARVGGAGGTGDGVAGGRRRGGVPERGAAGRGPRWRPG